MNYQKIGWRVDNILKAVKIYRMSGWYVKIWIDIILGQFKYQIKLDPKFAIVIRLKVMLKLDPLEGQIDGLKQKWMVVLPNLGYSIT